MIGVLFVCMGNICRSPMAEGAFRAAVQAAGMKDTFNIDSAGTIGYHAGSPPDARAQAAARTKGVNITRQRSRKVVDADFEKFDYIMAMDRENMADLKARCPAAYQTRIHLFLSFMHNGPLDEMPDPYYGQADQFTVCYSAAEEAAAGLLTHIKEKHF